MPRHVVFTAIFGDYEYPLDAHLVIDCEYICFTDDPALVDPKKSWQIKHVKPVFPDDPARSARLYKTCPHRFLKADYTFWTGGNRMPILNPFEWSIPLLEEQGADLGAHSHPDRDCFWDEGHACIRFKRGSVERIEKQLDFYASESMPRHWKLWACGHIIRRHTEAVARFNEFWWSQINKFSARDQISFAYTVWKLGIPIATFPGHLSDREKYVWRQGHKR